MKINENPWKSIKFRENQWKLIKIYENLWSSIKFNEILRNFIKSNWKSMKRRPPPPKSMKIHKTANNDQIIQCWEVGGRGGIRISRLAGLHDAWFTPGACALPLSIFAVQPNMQASLKAIMIRSWWDYWRTARPWPICNISAKLDLRKPI